MGNKGREGRDDSVTGKGCAAIFLQGCLVKKDKHFSSQSSSSLSPLALAPLLEYFLLTIILHTKGRSSVFMGPKLEEPKLLLLLGEDQPAVPGGRVCFLVAVEVLGEGQQCQVLTVSRVREKLLRRKIFIQLSLTAACCLLVGFAEQDAAVLHVVSVPNQSCSAAYKYLYKFSD